MTPPLFPANQITVPGALKRYLRSGHRLLTAWRKRALIFVYHRVAEPLADPWGLCVSPERFAEQLLLFQGLADVLPLEAIVHAKSDRDLPDRPLVITFDDGYADVLLNAKPILEDLRTPATVFVTSGYLDAAGEVWSDELARLILLSDEDPLDLAKLVNVHPDNSLDRDGAGSWYAWEPAGDLRQWLYRVLYDRLLHAKREIREAVLDQVRGWCGRKPEEAPPARFLTSGELTQLAASRWIEIGAHTVTHPVLAELEPARQKYEIEASKESLEALTGRPVRSFAYPYGKKSHFNIHTMQAVQTAGLYCGCANYGRPVVSKTSRWALPRYQILNWQANFLAKEVSRWYRE